jgi:hypothetical protein
MKNLRIIVATTFRDFKGTENDELQREFLKSLSYQTYRNFEIVVTLFGEKNVKSEVEKFELDSYFYDSMICGNYRYSLTEVVLNAIRHASSRYDSYLICWTTCDVIYDRTFFETIVKHYEDNYIGTSHPHIIFSSIGEFRNKSPNRKVGLLSGFDVIFFDKKFIENPKVRSNIEKYVFYDWGVFEHFLISLNELSNSVKMVNIYEESKIYKVENNRELTNESNQFLVNSHRRNSKVFINFLEEMDISKEYFDLVYCHLKFTIPSKKYIHYLTFSRDIVAYIRRRMLRIIASKIPKNIKSIIKRRIRK